jgi:hypothetical protein
MFSVIFNHLQGNIFIRVGLIDVYCNGVYIRSNVLTHPVINLVLAGSPWINVLVTQQINVIHIK